MQAPLEDDCDVAVGNKESRELLFGRIPQLCTHEPRIIEAALVLLTRFACRLSS